MRGKECAPAWDKAVNGCRFFGVDPDGAYCGHPDSLAITGFGLSPNAMSREGLCTHGETGKHELWQAPKETLK